MPQYLRKDSVRLLESSMEALALAITGLGLPVRREFKDECSRYATPIGLIGVAAEQAMSAVLVQTFGPEVMKKTDQRYKASREILDEMRSLLRNPVPRASFLTSGIKDEKAHRDLLLTMTDGFTVLTTERATGLHAGKGPSREVVCVVADKVHAFMAALSRSNRIRPYLGGLPTPPQAAISPTLMIEDLVAKLSASEKPQDRAILLSSIFLVLPEVPEVAPDWIEALDRVALAPRDEDLNLLLTTLTRAIPVQFQRTTAAAETPLRVAVRQADPGAIPVAPQQLRRSFTQIHDQFGADVGNANGRLDAGILDLPPEDFVLDLSVIGQDGIRRFLGKPSLTAQEAWPFIVSALHTRGTAGPYWFLVRMTEDHGNLLVLVTKAMRLVHGDTAKARRKEFTEGLESIRSQRPLPRASAWLAEIGEMHALATSKRERLEAAAQRNAVGERSLAADAAAVISKMQTGEIPIGLGMGDVLAAATPDGKPYWARTLAEAADDPEDLRSMVGLLNDPSVGAAYTAARKAIRLIDATTFGPPMSLKDD